MKRILLVTFSIFLCTQFTLASEPPDKNEKAIPDTLVSIHLIEKFKERINLTPEQQDTLKALSEDLKEQTQNIKEEMENESNALKDVLSSTKVNERDAKLILYRIFDLESALRMQEIMHLIRVKNTLTKTQQEQLLMIKSKRLKTPNNME